MTLVLVNAIVEYAQVLSILLRNVLWNDYIKERVHFISPPALEFPADSEAVRHHQTRLDLVLRTVHQLVTVKEPVAHFSFG